MTHQVMAAVDGSAFSTAVCDASVWASTALAAPLTFLHVVDSAAPKAELDLSGHIGLGAREQLLQELASIDEQRAKVSQQQGRWVLEAAVKHAQEHGVAEPQTRQRNGTLVETLEALQDEMRLLIIGQRGQTAHQDRAHLGSNLERVVRALHRPILMVPEQFQAPQQVMLAFDGSMTTRKGVEMLAKSPLFQGVPVHVVMVGAVTADVQTQLDWAVTTLQAAGHLATQAILSGEVEASLRAYQTEHDIDCMVMGAYGHSRIRQLLVGSTTTEMLRHATIPILLLR